MSKRKTYEIKLTAAVVIGGEIARAKSSVIVDEATAKDLLRRGKGTLVAGHDDQADADSDVDLASLNKAQLVDVAEQLGIEGAANMTKAGIIEAIEAAEAA